MFVVMEAVLESLELVSCRSKRVTAGRHGGELYSQEPRRTVVDGERIG